MDKHPLLDPKPKTDYVIIGVQFSRSSQTYFYRAPPDMGIELGDRIITPNKESFSVPTVTGIYPRGSLNEREAVDWVVQKIDTTRYEALKREYALD